jgi:adenine-specific DNA-methyltransferase
MTQNGSFTDILFPHDEALFEGASIDVVVFRYEKGLKQDKTLVNGKEMFCNVMNGIVTFSDTLVQGTPLQDMFHVYVGLVSARDEVYRVPFGNTEILVDKDKVERFIFTETFPTSSEQINTHLLSHKETLLARGIRKFSDANWFEWGAPRNIMNIRKYEGRPCIYVRNLTRQKEVGFLGTVRYFGGALLCLIPKTEMSEYTLKKVVMYINSTAFQSEYMYAGRFKIGQKQLCNASLPSP